jgi:RNase P subunit RPR2
MKNGTCPKCNSSKVYFKPRELREIRLHSRQTEYTDYVCTACGYFETYITDKEALSKIPVRAEKIGDWKRIQ